jgi:hypothetical protein
MFYNKIVTVINCLFFMKIKNVLNNVVGAAEYVPGLGSVIAIGKFIGFGVVKWISSSKISRYERYKQSEFEKMSVTCDELKGRIKMSNEQLKIAALSFIPFVKIIALAIPKVRNDLDLGLTLNAKRGRNKKTKMEDGVELDDDDSDG